MRERFSVRLAIQKCSHCGACEEVCSHATILMKCTQCNACVAACPRNAFVEVSSNIYSVDPRKCDGCGACVSACPENAIVLEGGKARKCDLCGRCVGVCPSGLRLEHTDDEERFISSFLGWRACDGEYKASCYHLSFDEAVLLRSVAEAFKDAGDGMEDVFDAYCAEALLCVDEGQRARLIGVLRSELLGFSVLDCLLEDDDLEEIAVNGMQGIDVFHRKRGWLRADVCFSEVGRVTELANRVARHMGRRLTMGAPRLNASLPDGSRLHAAIPPVVGEPVLSIRKFRKTPFSPRELVVNQTIDARPLGLLWAVMQSDFNVLVAGSTGSGKTTTLNALAAFIPLDERIIIVEETPEVVVPHRQCVRMVVNKEIGVGMGELVNDTLRMRPDRLVVGEVRTEEEVAALVNTMLAGQGKGSVATMHALSARECVSRLKRLGVHDADLDALDVIVVQRRWTMYDPVVRRSVDVRRVSEVAEVVDGKAVTLFSLDNRRRCLRKRACGCLEQRIADAFCLDARGLEKELGRRQAFLESAPVEFNAFVRDLNGFLFSA
ncbi:MAG: Flp pilus assembly complex ATPase component TadA [Candidatus Diapherotrites archaeon]|nr:Flp pilus assembly complex ATPase component TadA [Candidatus Diapherotrites archaeon]